MGGGGGRTNRLWRGHTKVEFMKASVGTDDFWLSDLFT